MSNLNKPTRVAIPILAVLVFLLGYTGLGVAQEFEVEHVEWSPPDPEADDDIIMLFDLRVRSAIPRFNDFVYRVEDFTLLVDLHGFLVLDIVVNRYSYSHDWERLDPGNYDVIFTTFIWYEERLWLRGEYRFQLHVDEAPVDQDFAVALAEGWNLISVSVAPEENDVPWIFRDLVRRESLTIVKDGFGRFYSPADDFNNIPCWNFKMAEADSLFIGGEPVAADTPIPLERGWNMIAYFPEDEIEAPAAFANIAGELIIVKDGDGNFYLPAEDFNNMPPLRRGSGYLVKVREDVELVWVGR